MAAFAFGFLGIAVLLLPIFLIAAAWRRLRRKRLPRLTGRGFGALAVLVALPALLQLTLGEVSWRGVPIASGGAVGRILTETLQSYLSFTGTLLLLLGTAVMGFTLLLQSTLGEFLGAANRKLQVWLEERRLGWAQRLRRRQQERSRRRVVDKHRARVAGEKSKTTASAVAAEAQPVRVRHKPGKGAFGVRRVQAGAAPVEPPAPAAKPETPQRKIPFKEAPPARKSGTLPPLDLLKQRELELSFRENELIQRGEAIRSRCAEFGVEGTIEGISPGPVITVYEFQPAPGVKVSQIVNLQDDLALALKAESVRIERLPGRSTLGIEVPNDERAIIRLGLLLGKPAFQRSPSALTMAIGMTIHGEPYYADLATMPHLLVAGATGSGKSVGLQSMITSIVYKATREQVQFIFIDPKRIELGVYRDIPHLKAEVVVEPKKAANALRWAVAEMERRYRLLAEVHVRSIDFYNQAIRDPKVRKKLALNEEDSEVAADELRPLPYYVIVIDELADLMMVASSDVETAIARLAQMARAVGIHLIMATQRPSVDVLTGTIKANFPCRMAFATASRHDSRTILDQVGAENLLGKGDMLFMPPGSSRLLRLHGAYISEQETSGLVRWLKKQGTPDLDPNVLKASEESRSDSGSGEGDDELFEEAARLVVAEQQASASFLQRRMRVGFSRAARLVDMMERDGLLGPPQGSKPREVLVKPDYFEEIDRARQHDS